MLVQAVNLESLKTISRTMLKKDFAPNPIKATKKKKTNITQRTGITMINHEIRTR